MSTHVVITVRHAKASHHAPGLDKDRPLTDAGVTQARELGKMLANHLQDLDIAFVSPAVRAQQTWENLAAGAGVDPNVPVSTEPVIYDGSPSQIAEMVLTKSPGTKSIVVGHEPTISTLAYSLVDEGGSKVEYGVPTGSAAIISADLPWDQWHVHCAKLVDFIHAPHH